MLHIKKSLLFIAVSGALVLTVVGVRGVDALSWSGFMPDSRIMGSTANPIKDKYIVVLKEDVVGAASVQQRADSLARRYGGSVQQRFSTALHGFSAHMDEQHARDMAKDAAVQYVVQDGIATAAGVESNPPSWGLDRIDQRSTDFDQKYVYPNTARNVTAYVLDTGVRISHRDFGGRAVNGYDFIDNDPIAEDCVGHGTHVAGTLAGKDYGVAKEAKIVAVRVLGCDATATYSQIIAGIDWVTAHHSGPTVANLSLAGPNNEAFKAAIRNSVKSGVVYTGAAGNNGQDACSISPANEASVITVGNVTRTDTRNFGSNFGSCVDLWAPGTAIVSASNASDTATQSMTGTSMSSPHVAGAVALILQDHPAYTPEQARSQLLADATSATVKEAGAGSPASLLYVASPATPLPPAACGTFPQPAGMAIEDLSIAYSEVAVGRCKNPKSPRIKVKVDITHTYRGDLGLDLIAPDGTAYTLKTPDFHDSARNFRHAYTLNPEGVVPDGTWRLRVRDTAGMDTGHLNSWSLSF